MKNYFDNLLSLSEAAGIWNIDDSVIRHAISSGKFEIDVDVKKFGKQWVITRQAMARIFGFVPKDGMTRYSKDKTQTIYFYISKLSNDFAKQEKISNSESMQIFKKTGIIELLFDCFDYYEHYVFEDLLKELTRRIKKGEIYVR